MGGGVFCKKKWKRGCFVKSGNGGGDFCKKVDLSSTQGACVQYQYFFILHFTYLEGAYAPNAPPLPTGLIF